MDKYFAFREMLRFLDENEVKVVDADMNYCGRIRIIGRDGAQTIIIDVTIEEDKNAQELE